MREHHGSCHCGRVQLLLRDEPLEAAACNCSICLRIGGLWHYCHPGLVAIEGAEVSYQQGDRALDLWHCPTCGCTTRWRELGYDSVLAPDAPHAIAELDKDSGRFHVLFSDVVMPGMSGIELAQRVRDAYPDLPIILTSGYSHVLAENGTYGFELLHKPYTVDQLSRVLQKASRWAKVRATD